MPLIDGKWVGDLRQSVWLLSILMKIYFLFLDESILVSKIYFEFFLYYC